MEEERKSLGLIKNNEDEEETYDPRLIVKKNTKPIKIKKKY